MQSETKSVTLSNANPVANTSLTMAPASGSGNIHLTINWATGSGIGYCKWNSSDYSALAGSPANPGSSVTINLNGLSSGTYSLTLSFYTSQASANAGLPPVYECTEYISVYPGLMTNKWTAGTAPHIGEDGNFSVTKECVETFVYRKIYVSQGASTSNATGTSERPFATIEQAMARLNEAASKGIRSGEITASNPWELHVSGTITATAITGSEGAVIEVDEDIKCLAIIGEGSGATIDANALGTVVHVGGGGGVSMENVTLKNGASLYGGGVYIFDGTFTMQSGSITGNTATYEGGGVYVADGGPEFIMYGGTISANTAGSNGGGVYCNGLFTMYDGTISGNSATNGKGVYIESNGVFTMLDGTITANTGTMGSGGGVYNSNTFNMYNGTISENSASGGNGVYVAEDGYFTMYNGTISGNSGSGGGGVSIQKDATFEMQNGTISGNTSFGDGGGVYISGTTEGVGTFEMYGGTISGNTATQDGGGVCVGNGGTDGAIFKMYEGSTIKGNTAQGGSSYTGRGGGVYSSGTFTMYGGTIGGSSAGDANKAEGYIKNGGGVYVAMHTFDMQGGIIGGNTVAAGGNGSGVYVTNGTPQPTFKMKGNARVDPSNDVYLNSSKITIADSITATTPAATITPANCRMNEPVLGGTAALIEANRTKFALSDSTYTINKGGNVWKDDLASLTYADMQTLIASPDAKTSSDLIMTPSSENGSWQWIHMIGTKYVVKTTAGRYCTLEITGISDDHVNVQTEVRLAGEETVHSWSFWGNDSDIDAVLGGESGNQNAKNDIHVNNGTPHNSAKFYIMEYVYTQ